MRTWRYIPYHQGSAFENMAIDEALFRESQRLSSSEPVLRFFSWAPAAVSIGYFQDIEKDINANACASAGIDVVRRITGGRAVFHQSEVTYAVIGREDDPLFPAGILGRYLAISQCLAKGLELFGIHAELAKSSRSGSVEGLDSFCFSVPSHHELLVHGRKICGSAQARANGSFLQHGSILLDFDPFIASRIMSPRHSESEGNEVRNSSEKSIQNTVTCIKQESAGYGSSEEVCSAIKTAVEQFFGVRFKEGKLTLEEENLKSELIRKKYRTDAWNRSRKSSF